MKASDMIELMSELNEIIEALESRGIDDAAQKLFDESVRQALERRAIEMCYEHSAAQ